MTVALRSLRVTSDLDATKYVAGMNQKIAADKAGAQSSVQVGDAVENTKVRVSSSLSVLERMSRQYVDGYGTAAKFNGEILRLARSQDTHAATVEHLEQVYSGLQLRYGLVANATELAERGYTGLAAAISNVNGRLEEQAVVATRAAASLQNVSAVNDNSRMGRGFAAQNAMFQFQDIGMTAAMGMSPGMIGLQQGTQLAGAYAGMTVKEAAATTGSALLGLVNPVSIMAVGFTAATAAAIQYFMSVSGESEEATKKLEEQREAIADVARKWGDATPALRDYVAQRERLKDVEGLKLSYEALAEDEWANARKKVEELHVEFSALINDITQANADPEAIYNVQTGFNAARDAILGGQDATKGFEQAQDGLAKTLKQTNIPAIADLITKVNELAEASIRASKAAADLRQQPYNVISGGSRVSDILEEQFFSDNGLMLRRKDFDPRPGTLPRPARRPLQELDWTEQDRERLEIENAQRRFAAERQALQARSVEQRAAAARAQEEATVIHGESDASRQSRVTLAEMRARIQGEHQLAEAQRDRARSLQETMQQQELEVSVIGKTVGQVAALQMEYGLMAQIRQEAYQNGIQSEAEFARVYGTQTALIKQRSAEYGRQVQAIATVRMEQSLQFERDQMFRSERDQKVASQMQGSLGYVDLDSEIAAGIRMNEVLREQKAAWEEIRDVGRSAVDTLVDGIGTGFENAGDIAIGIVKDITKQMLTLSVANPLKNALYGDSLPTMDSVGGIGGFFSALTGGKFQGAGAGASRAVGSMTVTAASVVINGGGLGGLAGLAGANDNALGKAPVGAVTRGTLDPIGEVMRAAGGAGGAGGALGFVGNYKSGVDARLTDILNTAAKQFPDFKVDAMSGFRPGDPRFHGRGLATDVQLTDIMSGRKLGNYQDAASFGSYEKFAQTARQVQMAKYPELSDDFRWGGYFGGGKGKYGAVDTMHFDLGGRRTGMGGGSWEGGLNSTQRALWPGAQSQGMDSAASAVARLGDSSKETIKGLNALGNGAGGLGSSLEQFGSALSQFPAAPKAGGGGIGGWLSSLFGGAFVPNGAQAQFAVNWAAGGGVGLFAGGGISDRPAIFGEAGPEAAVPLPDGRRIPVQLDLRGGMGQSQQRTVNRQVNIINAPPGYYPEVQEEDDEHGNEKVNVTFSKIAASEARRPGSALNKTLKGMGARQQRVRR